MPLRPPNERHRLSGIRGKSRPKAKNTIIIPGTDVRADLDGISAGRGAWYGQDGAYVVDGKRYEAEKDSFEIGGRTYGVEDSGTVFPRSGPGLVELDRESYKVLKQLIDVEGDIGAAREALRRNPAVTEAHWTSALEVFQHHKHYKGGA